MDGLPATLGHVSSPVRGLAHVMGVGDGIMSHRERGSLFGSVFRVVLSVRVVFTLGRTLSALRCVGEAMDPGEASWVSGQCRYGSGELYT